MVSLRRAPRRGAGSLGCLLSLLLFAVLHDDVIYRRLNAQADSLLTGGSPRFKITRGGRPSRIVIQGEYTDQVVQPLFKHTFVLRPRAVEAL